MQSHTNHPRPQPRTRPRSAPNYLKPTATSCARSTVTARTSHTSSSNRLPSRRRIPATNSHQISRLWKDVMAAQPRYMAPTANTRRRDEQDTASRSRPPSSRSQGTSRTPPTAYSGTSARTTDQYEAALEPHGIVIDQSGLSLNVWKHFGVQDEEPRILGRIGTLAGEQREALSGATLWLDPYDEEYVRFVQTEYKSMAINSMNEAEFYIFAMSNIFKIEPRSPHFVYEEGDTCWLPERFVQPVNKPNGDKWETLEAVRGESSYSWDIRPDCVYWISLRAFRLGFRSKVPQHVAVLQDRALCPYFTLEFKKDSDKNISRARNQVAIAACIALYNRWKLKQSRVSEWTDHHRQQLRHYCLTFMSSKWDLWCMTPTDFSKWSGCRMRRIYSGNCVITADVIQLMHWVNEIHYWGLTVHGPGCKDDIYARTRATADADHADISLLTVGPDD